MFVVLSGLARAEIAVIGSVAFVVLVMLCAAVVLYRFRACSCGKKSYTTTASEHITLSQHKDTEV